MIRKSSLPNLNPRSGKSFRVTLSNAADTVVAHAVVHVAAWVAAAVAVSVLVEVVVELLEQRFGKCRDQCPDMFFIRFN